MPIINNFNPYDQLLSHNRDNNSSVIHNIHALPGYSDLQAPDSMEAETRILEGKTFEFSPKAEASESLDLDGLERAPTEKEIFHRVPKSLIKELGADTAAVLYGFSLILKSHKRNKRDGRYWYYDTLDQLLAKRWPYLKRSSLFDIVTDLSQKEYLLISKENKMGFDRTMHYSMYMSKIDQVLDDVPFLFNKTIAEKVGILGALVFHNIQYQISNPPVDKVEIRATGEHKPKINNLAQVFCVSESTVKRQLKALISEGLLKKGENKGCYSLPRNVALSKNGSNPDENIQICTAFNPEKIGSNPDEDGSFSDEAGSNSDKNGSNSDNNTIYETNEKHIGIQIRSAPRAFLKKEETEESKIHSTTQLGFETLNHSDPLLNQELGVSPTIETFIECPFDSNPYTLLTHSETALEVPQSGFPIHHSGSDIEGQESPAIDQEINQLTIFSEISIPEGVSANLGKGKIEQSYNFSNISFEDSDSIQKNKSRGAGLKSVVSFGRTIAISKSSDSKFEKLVGENSRLGKSFSAHCFDEKQFIKDRFLALSVRFIESLTREKRILLLDQNSPEKVLSLIYEDAFDFLEGKLEEFSINGQYILSQEKMFPFLPFFEITVRGILLLKKAGDNPFRIESFLLYSIFETLSSGLLDDCSVSPETKSLLFNFLILRARTTRFDKHASNGDILDLNAYHGEIVSGHSGYSSESEFNSLVRLFGNHPSICAEEVYFKYAKCIEWRVVIGKTENEYDERWGCVNFKDISQFSKFFEKINGELITAYCDFDRPWKSDTFRSNRFSCEDLKNANNEDSKNGKSVESEKQSLLRIQTYFEAEKRKFISSYVYLPTRFQEEDFKDALKLCREYDLAPEDIVDLAVELLVDNRSQVSSIHLRGPLVRNALLAEIVNNSRNTGLVTNDNIECDDIWKQLVSLVKLYIKNGEQQDDILLNSSLKLYGWFRILATEYPNQKVIDKYKHIANKELNYKIRRFIRKQGLDLSRICG